MNQIFKKHKFLIIIIIILLLVINWFALVIDGKYGTTLFLTIPSSIAFFIGYSQRYNSESNDRFKKIIKGLFIIMVVVATLSGLLILIGLEGAICILMAFPFLIIPMFIAYIIGIYIAKTDKKNTLNSIIFIVLLNPTTYIYDSFQTPIKEEVITELIVNNSQENIWKLLTTEFEFKQTKKMLFQEGISYPKSICLKEIKNQKTFNCYTNNDTILLKIDQFIKNEKIKFHLKEQTIPMKELSPYKEVHAAHLHNYFEVNYGEIKLEYVAKNKTKIIAKTSYNYKIAPKWYWELWSNYIINEMHLHVLESIK